MILDNRKTSILFSVIEEHVRTAEPVASQAISNTRSIDASSATIRSEMGALEDAGYLIQPYTSAGRVPTERAYRLYIESIQHERQSPCEVAALRVAVRMSSDLRETGKSIARALAGLATEAIVIGFTRGDAYATGIAYLVAQPEFQDQTTLQEFSEAVDRLDETLDALSDLLNGNARVVLGSENPFGRQCGTIATRLALPAGHELTLGIVGPMRMAYSRQLGLLQTVKDALHNP